MSDHNHFPSTRLWFARNVPYRLSGAPCLYPLSEDATPGEPSLSAVIIELLSTICKILSAFLLGLESKSLHFRQFKNGSDFLSKAVYGKTVGIWASIVPYIIHTSTLKLPVIV